MLAVVLNAYGGPEQLVPRELQLPPLAPGRARVRIQACGLNRRDLGRRRGRPLLPGERGEFPLVLGSDIAGVVEEIHAPPDDLPPGLAPGQPVVVYPAHTCGNCPACQRGQDPLCPRYRVLEGGYATHVDVPLRNLVPLPAGIPFTEAASLPVAGITAWEMLVTRGRVNRGDRVLVVGASGGVGTFAVQLARLHGARVAATAGSEAKAARLAGLGAGTVLRYDGRSPADLGADLAAWAGEHGVDILLDLVGSAAWEAALPAMAVGGRIITCASHTGTGVDLNIRQVFVRQLEIHGVRLGSRAHLPHLLGLVAAGQLAPVADVTFPLPAAAAAHALMEAGNHFGKVVLTAP